MNMIEKVARAIDKAGAADTEATTGIKGNLCFDTDSDNKRLMMALAKAAIEAMKEPTEEIIDIIAASIGSREEARLCYIAAIEQVLKQ